MFRPTVPRLRDSALKSLDHPRQAASNTRHYAYGKVEDEYPNAASAAQQQLSHKRGSEKRVPQSMGELCPKVCLLQQVRRERGAIKACGERCSPCGQRGGLRQLSAIF